MTQHLPGSPMPVRGQRWPQLRASRVAVLVASTACSDGKGDCDYCYIKAGTLPAGYELMDDNEWSHGSYACEDSSTKYKSIGKSFQVGDASFGISATTMETVFDTSSGEWNNMKPEVALSHGGVCATRDWDANPDGGPQCLYQDSGPDPSGSDYVMRTFCSTDDGNECAHDDCVIVFYTELTKTKTDGSAIKWTYVADTSAGANEISLYWGMVHELGHTLGLGENDSAKFSGTIMDGDLSFDEGSSSSVANAGKDYTSGPSTDDEAAFEYMYGYP